MNNNLKAVLTSDAEADTERREVACPRLTQLYFLSEIRENGPVI